MDTMKCDNAGPIESPTKTLIAGDYIIPEGFSAEINIEGRIVVVRKEDRGFKRAIGEIVEFIEWADMRGSVREDFHQRKRPTEWVNFLKNLEDPRVSVARERACSFIEFLDKNSYAGKMCVSNPECEDIVNAFVEKDWAKLVAYANKYLRGAAEGRTVPLSSKCQEWIDAVECVAGAFPPGSKGYDMVIGSIHDLIKYLKSPCLENRLWSEEDEKNLVSALQHISYSRLAESSSNLTNWLKAIPERIKSIRPQHNLRWRRAKAGENLPESIIIPDGEEPRFGKCAVKDSYYIPVEELKNLPKDES